MLVYNKDIVMHNTENKQGRKRVERSFCILAIFTVLTTVLIPCSSTSAKGIYDRDTISIGIGIDKYIGIEVISNEPGTDVDYSDGVYSKTMVGGEKLENFGTTTLKVICNFDSNDDIEYYGGHNCRDNGWTLITSPVHTTIKEGTAYASMIADNSSAAILSKNNSFSGTESNWAIKVSPVQRTIEGSDVSPTITSGYTTPHIIPATSTEIASGKSWKTIGGVDTYIDSFGVSVQYGINIDGSQAAGTYTGAVNYTASLKASS